MLIFVFILRFSKYLFEINIYRLSEILDLTVTWTGKRNQFLALSMSIVPLLKLIAETLHWICVLINYEDWELVLELLMYVQQFAFDSLAVVKQKYFNSIQSKNAYCAHCIDWGYIGYKLLCRMVFTFNSFEILLAKIKSMISNGSRMWPTIFGH